MFLLTMLAWTATLLQVVFLTLCLAAGLYYVAELVEEYTVATGRLIRYMNVLVAGVYVLLAVFEELPWSMIVVGLLSSVAFHLVLTTFPTVQLSSLAFLVACCLVVVNHYLTFRHFSEVYYPFSEVVGFFTVCLWLMPLAFFVSLNANDSVLPTTADSLGNRDADVVSDYFRRKMKKYGLLSFLRAAEDTILPQRVKKGY